MAYIIDEKKCLGCGACAFACLFDIPKATDEKKNLYVIDTEKCYGCGMCENICPVSAISPAPGHKKLIKVTIDKEKCLGCSLCARACVPGAAHGKIKEPFDIDQNKCIQCGACLKACRKGAIEAIYE